MSEPVRVVESMVSFYCIEHGRFTTDVGHVELNMREPKAYLAQSIVDCYGGGCGRASVKAYWLKWSKWELAILLAGMQYPCDAAFCRVL